MKPATRLLCAVAALGLFMWSVGAALRLAFPQQHQQGQQFNRHTAPPVLGGQGGSCSVEEHASDLCAYLSTAPECVPPSLVNYTWLYYCAPLPRAIVIIACLVWIVLLFYWLAVAADAFLSPSLQNIATGFGIPNDVAGLTFMALANGAPDVFSTFAAVTNHSYGISVGELLGSGIYVTTVVVAAVSFVSVAKVQQFAFVRDCATYLVAIVIFFWMLCDGYVSVLDASVMMVFYLCYVVFASVYSVWRQRRAAAESALADVAWPESSLQQESEISLDSMEDSYSDVVGDEEDNDDVVTEQLSPLLPMALLQRIRSKWGSLGVIGRVVWVFSATLRLPLTLSCPNVDFQDEYAWHRGLNAGTFLLSPLVVNLAIAPLAADVNRLVLWLVPPGIGIAAAAIVFFLTRWNGPPTPLAGRMALSFTCFIVSVVWVYLCASELVAILRLFGLLLGISDVILGATVLAWGSSMGDTFSSIAVAQQGLPEMSMGAAYGGPLFNLLFGSAVSLLVVTIRMFPAQYPTPLGMDSLLSGVFLVFNLVVSLIVAHWNRYTLPRAYGIWLVVLYLCYDAVLVLFGAGLISNTAINQ